jgi:tRNA A37 threonylcarbamoyladenosine dehydratase
MTKTDEMQEKDMLDVVGHGGVGGWEVTITNRDSIHELVVVFEGVLHGPVFVLVLGLL